jgi:hypothetical protein
MLLMLIFNVSVSSAFPIVNGGHTLPERINMHFAKMADMVEPYVTTMLINTTLINRK